MDQSQSELYLTPTVSRIVNGTIVELVYDPDARKTAFVVSKDNDTWRIEPEFALSAGEKLIPYSAHNNLIAHKCVLLPSEPVDFGTKESLLADIGAFLHRYVDLSPLFEGIASHYVLLTWLYDAFAEVPYLRLQGEYGTGKTRGLLAIGSLCYKPFFAAGASTVSPIFHTLDRFGGTLVLDEADFRFTDATADLVKILNNGTVKGLPVLRTMQNRHKEFNPAAFNVFGPKIIAMRGSFEDEALESRFLTEETGMRPLRSDIPLHLPDSLHDEALSIRNRLLHFRLCTRRAVRPNSTLASAGLHPRANQIVLPLLSLIDDRDLRDDVCEMLHFKQRERQRTLSQTIEAQVLRAALDALIAADGGDVSVQSITDVFNSGADVGISARRVGAVLKNAFRIETRKSHGTFVVSASDAVRLAALATRYRMHERQNSG